MNHWRTGGQALPRFVAFKGMRIEVVNNWLDLSNKGIHDITDVQGLEGLGDLESLILSNNHIWRIEGLSKLRRLKVLDLRNNQIKEISGLENLHTLQELYLSGNPIGDVMFKNGDLNKHGRVVRPQKFVALCEQRKSPDASKEGKITSYPAAIATEPEWKVPPRVPPVKDPTLTGKVVLWTNPDKRLPAPPQKETAPVVKTSPVITGHVVVQNKEIAVENGKLDLSSRSIKDIAEIAGFKDVKQLKHLKLGNNYLKDINGFGDLAGLEVLELQNNEIVEITGIERLVNLVRLNLNSNRLKDIAGLGVLARLEFLAIANNSISAVPRLPGLSHLKFLHIAGNPIDETMLERVGGVDKDGYARNPQKIIREGIAPVTARGASHVDAEGKKSTPEAPGSGNPDREDSWASEKKDRNWKLDKFDDM